MKKLAICIGPLVVLCLTGCGNVCLKGDALAAAQTGFIRAGIANEVRKAQPECCRRRGPQSRIHASAATSKTAPIPVAWG